MEDARREPTSGTPDAGPSGARGDEPAAVAPDNPGPDEVAGPVVELSAGTGHLVAGLLEVLAELPSTADIVADGAHLQASRVVERLPRSPRRTTASGDRIPAGSLFLDLETATEVVELLELFAELPSTPPAVAVEARQHAEDIARRLGPEDPAPPGSA